MNTFIESLGFDKTLSLKLQAYINKHRMKISLLCKICRVNFEVLSFCSDLMCLAVCLEYAQKYTFRLYKEKGISQKIFLETMKDIVIWCENNGNKGLKNFRWIKNHLNCELFRIGRLQYQFSVCRNVKLNYSEIPLKYGENVIYIHIPQGEKLLISQCEQSVSDAKNFFEAYYPEYNYQFFFSESWLLYSKNKEFMSAASNIVNFQTMFDLVYSYADDRQAIERIFGNREHNAENYPEKTTLQRSAKKYIIDGKSLGVGIGIIDKDKI